jgi:hypothetical protein
MYHAKRLILAALFVASLTPLALSQSVGTCFTDWSAASIIVKAESLFPVDQLAKLAPSKLNADVVRSALCETQTGFVYKLVVRDKSGVLKSLTVDAKHPFDR